MTPQQYFNKMTLPIKKQYDALREYFHYGQKAEVVASKYGYTVKSFYWMVHNFKQQLTNHPDAELFFQDKALGRKPMERSPGVDSFVIKLRKHNYSCDDIVAMGQAQGYDLNYNFVYHLLKENGFAALYRRSKKEKTQLENPLDKAPRSEVLENRIEQFSSANLGILCFLPLIKKYGLDKVIEQTNYPQTSQISRLSSILCFLALKLSSVKRYSKDDLWCMDRGSGLFAGLNVLPKTAWFSSYSDRVNRQMNIAFLKKLHKVWLKHDLLGDTCNLDFTTIPYWGEEEPLENNWSGKRNKALAGMLAVLAENPDSGLIDYADATIVHKNQDAVVLEFLDFYKTASKAAELKYLVFDSKFTTYENLSKLDDNQVRFITIRRRGKNILEDIEAIPADQWKTIRVDCAGDTKRFLKVNDQTTFLKGYEKQIRQIIIESHGREKPALIITNDFNLPCTHVVRKYCHRWLVEKTISEQVDFFHLNRLSSSMVIKVDFDLTMSILAYNLYRVFALETEKYASFTAQKVFDKLICNSGTIKVQKRKIEIIMKKKRSMPVLLDLLHRYQNQKYQWLHDKQLLFRGATIL